MDLQQSSSFNLLNTKIQQWVWKQGWHSLKEIQENAIPPILDGNYDVIISAATAGGKTEAVFLPVLTNLINDENSKGYQVLYISPLKSLINDQYRRLMDMTKDMSIDVVPWHGDISSSKKQKSLKNPNGILIITPESLESLLIHHNLKLKNAFRYLKYVVIDELHAFIAVERGKQLQSLMSRIEYVIEKKVPRIAMSATFSDYEIVKDFLRQDHSYPCVIPNQGTSSHELKVLIKEYTYGYNEKPHIDKIIADDLFIQLRGSNNLVFTNNRQECETFSLLLSEKSDYERVPNEFRIHHGSISKESRTKVEFELQSDKMPITAICTSTLELGVDIGKVKSIAQIETANSVSSLRQRLGRSGRRDEASVLRIYSSDYVGENADLLDLMNSNLFQNIAVIELLKEHKYEIPNINGIHLSTLIQQILSVIAQYGSFNPQEGWLLLCKNGAFRNVSANLFMSLLRDLGKADVIQQTSNGQIVIGNVGEEILLDKEFYAAFTTYPELDIVNLQTGDYIGSIMIDKIGVGACIIFGGKKWSVKNIDYLAKKAYVIPYNFGELPIFQSEGADVDRIIVQKMKDIYLSNNEYSYLDKKTNALKCLHSARSFFKRNKLYHTFCNCGDEELFMTWAGPKVNRTISLMSMLFLDEFVGFNHIYIKRLNKENVLKMIKHPKPKAEELSPFLMRFSKETKKYDYLLSDELLNIQYSSMYLDVDGAWEMMNKISN